MGPTTGVWLLLRLLHFRFKVSGIYVWGAMFSSFSETHGLEVFLDI